MTLKHRLFLSILFVIVNGILFWKLGVSVDDDTESFLTYAEEIKERGIFFKPHDFWYIAYPLFIILMTSIHDSLGMVVFGQVALSYLALMSLYASGKRLFGNPKAGLVAGLLFLGFFMISFWNFWIYCESLLISLNCLSIYFLIKWFKNEGNLGNYILGILVIVAAFFTKPTGIALLGGILISVGFIFWVNEKFRKVRWAGLIGGFFLFILLLNQMLSTFGFVEAYQMGEVVYNVHKLADKDYATWLILEVPENLFVPASELPPIFQFVSIIIGNPIYSLQLFGTKLFFFLFYLRPYYSLAHNALALAVLLPVYVFFFHEMIKGSISKPFKILVFGFILISILSTSLMTINWNSRFLVPILPVIFLIAANKLGIVFQKGLEKNLIPTT
ncbi:hypothetical protein EF405_12165 [Cyclobacteriaceae bacterium YHN15]|nr:hypothetical protein EF405_12165 [Cyclobacteriaceae bacterium YHN15]